MIVMNILIVLLVSVSCLLNLIAILAILQTKKQTLALFNVVLAYYSYVLPIVFVASILNYFSWLNLAKIILLSLLNLIFIHLAIFLLKNQ